METRCEHYATENDDSFLLDDENAANGKCLKCRKPSSLLWSNKTGENSWTQRETTNSGMDEHEPPTDALEDSPLLINDICEDSTDFHCHSILSHSEDLKAWKKLAMASLLCFLFMLSELVGGYIAGSLAVMTDAAHLFSDFVGFIISLLSIWIARKSATSHMTFGFYRAEVLGAFLSVLTIWLLAGIFAALALYRLCRQNYEINANTMILMACLGLIVNIVMGAILHGFCHNHTHGHSLSQTASNNDNINVRAAAAHVLGDVLQSLGVLVAALTIKIFPQAQLADPICTLIFSIIVVCTTLKVARDSVWILLERSPANSYELAMELNCIPNVQHIHNLHVWTLSPGKNAIAVHLSVDDFCDRDVVLKEATSIIKNKLLNVVSCTIQIERHKPSVVNSCKYCQPDYFFFI